MDPDKLDEIEDVYAEAIGKDAKVIRVLIQEIRRLQREVEMLAESM